MLCSPRVPWCLDSNGSAAARRSSGTGHPTLNWRMVARAELRLARLLRRHRGSFFDSIVAERNEGGNSGYTSTLSLCGKTKSIPLDYLKSKPFVFLMGGRLHRSDNEHIKVKWSPG